MSEPITTPSVAADTITPTDVAEIAHERDANTSRLQSTSSEPNDISNSIIANSATIGSLAGTYGSSDGALLAEVAGFTATIAQGLSELPLATNILWGAQIAESAARTARSAAVDVSSASVIGPFAAGDATAAERVADQLVTRAVKCSQSAASKVNLYIPPPGIRFRLLGKVTGSVLYYNYWTQEIGQESADTFHDEQYWRLKSVGDDYALRTDSADMPYYLSYNDVANAVVLSSSKPRIKFMPGSATSDGHQWFRLVEVGEFTWYKFYCRTFRNPNVGAEDISWTDYDDQLFRFDFEEMVIDSVRYDLANGWISESQPVITGSATFSNGTTTVQERKPIISVKMTKSASWERTKEFTVGAKAEFSAKIPYVTEGLNIELSATAMTGFKWGETKATEISYTEEILIKAEPGLKYRVTTTAKQGYVCVPYVMTLHSKKNPQNQATSTGYAGIVTYWESGSSMYIVGPADPDPGIGGGWPGRGGSDGDGGFGSDDGDGFGGGSDGGGAGPF